MEEMINRLFEELAKQTERAVNAENLAEALRANVDKYQSDAAYWKKAFFDKDAEFQKLMKQMEEESENEHI